MFKLYTDRQEKSWAIAFSGSSDKYLDSFFSYLHKHRTYEGFLKFISGIKREDRFSLPETVAVVPRDVIKRGKSIAPTDTPTSLLEQQLLKYSSGEEKPQTEIENFLYRVFAKLTEMKDDPVQEAIRTKHFEEFALHNRFYARRSSLAGEYDEENTPQLILASNKPRIDLFQVDVAGNLIAIPSSKELEYICLGSGQDHVEEYFEDTKYEKDPNIPDSAFPKSKISFDQININAAFWLAYGAVTDAIIQDPNSGGLVDMVIVKKDKVTHLGPEVQEAITDEVRSIYKRMSQDLIPKPPISDDFSI